MKKLFTSLLLLFTVQLTFTQTFEYQYTGDYGAIYQVAENEYVYGILNYTLRQFSIYSLDHTLIKTIQLTPDSIIGYQYVNLSKTLFNSDSKFELVYNYQANSTYGVRVVDEDGNVLFFEPDAWGVTLKNTDQGAKMILSYVTREIIKVYSLYGTVFKVDEKNPDYISHLFPNPSSDKVKIDFNVPGNEPNLVLSIYTIDGKLINQLNISSKLTPLQLDVSTLDPGVYLYRIHNETFSTPTNKFIVKR
jgi:hypothetical protein